VTVAGRNPCIGTLVHEAWNRGAGAVDRNGHGITVMGNRNTASSQGKHPYSFIFWRGSCEATLVGQSSIRHPEETPSRTQACL